MKMKKRKKIIKIDYDALKNFLLRENLVVHESSCLGDGILGKFYPPNIILINPDLCDKCDPQYFEEQKRVLVLLHEMCHWSKWLEHQDNPKITDEEACFNFEEIVCRGILNEEGKLHNFAQTIEKMGIQKACRILMKVTKTCQKPEPYVEHKYKCCGKCSYFSIHEENNGQEICSCEIHGYHGDKDDFSEYSEICEQYEK